MFLNLNGGQGQEVLQISEEVNFECQKMYLCWIPVQQKFGLLLQLLYYRYVHSKFIKFNQISFKINFVVFTLFSFK